MDEQLRIILIIIVSVSIFGLLVFVFVKNYIKNKIDVLAEENKKNKLTFKIVFELISSKIDFPGILYNMFVTARS